MSQTVPFFISIPHSGEKVPDETPWLQNLSEVILMSDVDRFVDRLYEPALIHLNVPSQKTEWHRYAVDLNRIPEDIDAASVVGAIKKAGTHSDGYHWVMTKNEDILMSAPMSLSIHLKLTQLIYEPFHLGVRNHYKSFEDIGHKNIFHIDAHSMPGIGTRMHRDPGQKRADIVVSDCAQKSCTPKFKDLVIQAYEEVGFRVAYNWPYLGGRVTEHYGQPNLGQHALQVEMNRSLYMDEVTKQILPQAQNIQNQLLAALTIIKSELPKLCESL